MIDFDKDFEDYLVAWYKAHESEFQNIEEMEDKLPDIYNEWADSPCESIGDLAPREFFSNITSPDELVKLLTATSSGGLNPCSLLLDRIAEVKECADGLEKLLNGNYSVKQKMLAANLISEIGAQQPLMAYMNWLADSGCERELKDLAVEILSENADDIAPTLYLLIAAADTELKTDIAEILVNAKKDERTYNLLIELFKEGADIPLCAGYLGKYGDERSAGILYEALGECNYLEYIEIKNAIERLGGIVDDTRDFSNDKYFNALKNTK